MKQKLKDRDFTSIARNVVERAIGTQWDGSELQDPNSGKNIVAMHRGKLGGLKGGKARALKLSAKKRKTIAVKAAKARWKK